MPDSIQTVTRSGGQILVDALRAHGVDRVFCVPGESYLPVLDALHDSAIDVVVARHEGAAANMAEADGKLTGRPGICFVTRGPGATHASVGVHTARQDSTPMILFVGQVDRGMREREAFQEVDYRQMFGGLAKWAAEIDAPERIPEFLAHAFATAVAGRPGPVVLALPEDVLFAAAAAPEILPTVAFPAAPSPAAIDAIRAELERAKAPLVVVGGSGWTEQACADLTAFAETQALPVAAAFRRQDLFDNDHPLYAGQVGLAISPALAQRVRGADLLLAFGPRLGEATTGGYTLIESPVPRQRLVHAHPDPEELGRVFSATLPVCAAMPPLLAALRALPPRAHADMNWARQAHADFEAFTRRSPKTPAPGGVDMEQVIARLAAELPPDTLVANGAGNYTVWLHRFWRYRRPRTELAPTSGAMGYGLPAAIAGKLRHPDRTVLCFAGDGCFLMYPQELATAVQENAAVIVLVVDNGMYGTIRMHQERHYPGRVTATGLRNPDFCALARAFGAHAEAVETTESFWPAFERARESGRPALLWLRTDPAQLTPDLRISARD
jgi:acetolactate synthase-1/2/3 large subunit